MAKQPQKSKRNTTKVKSVKTPKVKTKRDPEPVKVEPSDFEHRLRALESDFDSLVERVEALEMLANEQEHVETETEEEHRLERQQEPQLTDNPYLGEADSGVEAE